MPQTVAKNDLQAVVDYHGLKHDAEGLGVHGEVVALVNGQPEPVDYGKFRTLLGAIIETHGRKLVANETTRYLHTLDVRLKRFKRGQNWFL